MSGSILCLDLATQMGWCEGEPGGKATSGTHRLAPQGAHPAAISGGLIEWLGQRLTTFRYRMIAYEAPMDPRHMKTNINTARLLLGLCAIVEGVAYQTGHGQRLREVNVHDVRKHLLGGRPPKGEAKTQVTRMVTALGHKPADDNEADAIAIWHYASAIADSRIAQMTTPLFNR